MVPAVKKALHRRLIQIGLTFLVISLVGGLAVGMVLADNGAEEGAVAASDAGDPNGLGGSVSEGVGAAAVIGPGPDWFEFSHTEVGVPTTGCAPADPAGQTCTPSFAGNSMFAPRASLGLRSG